MRGFDTYSIVSPNTLPAIWDDLRRNDTHVTWLEWKDG